MKTDPCAPAPAAHLIPVRDFAAVARNAGIVESERTLVATGRLTRLQVGRADFYSLAEVLDAAPGTRYPVITDERPALADLDHTITVERTDPVTARAQIPDHHPDELLGGLAVVERHHGRLSKVCAIQRDGTFGYYDTDAGDVARSYADTYGARYIPAESTTEPSIYTEPSVYEDMGVRNAIRAEIARQDGGE